MKFRFFSDFVTKKNNKNFKRSFLMKKLRCAFSCAFIVKFLCMAS